MPGGNGSDRLLQSADLETHSLRLRVQELEEEFEWKNGESAPLMPPEEEDLSRRVAALTLEGRSLGMQDPGGLKAVRLLPAFCP